MKDYQQSLATDDGAAPKKALSVGELLWDILPEGRQCGGAPANVVYHALRCGLDARICTAVGRDADGDGLVAFLESKGMKTDLVSRSELPTGTVTVALDANGVPNYTIHQPAAWDDIAATPAARAFAAQADFFCFGSLAQRQPASAKAIFELAAMTRPDALRVFDVNLRQDFYSPDVLELSLNTADVLKISDNELPVFRAIFHLPDDDSEALHAIRERFGLQFVLYTMGADGSRFLSVDGDLFQPAVAAGPVIDTVGCGDAFLGAFLAAWARQRTPADALAFAARIAGLVACHSGAMPDSDAYANAITRFSKEN